MPIQEPITALTSLPILFFSLFASISLARKASGFSIPFFFLALMSLCGTLYHIDNYTFYSLQKYGTMIFGGIFSASLAIAALYDTLSADLAKKFSLFPLALLTAYLFTIGSDSFLPFIILQAASILVLFAAYSKHFPSRKTLFIYAAGLTFITAGLIQAQPVKFFVFNHNDLFHIISLLSIALLYGGMGAGQADSEKHNH